MARQTTAGPVQRDERKRTTLTALVAEYSAAVRRSRPSVLAAEIQEAKQRGHGFLLEILCRVLGMVCEADNPDHQADRARVLGELAKQMEHTRNRRAARRRRAAARAVAADADAAA